MTAPTFRRILLPIEFEIASSAEAAGDHGFELGKDRWLVLGPATMTALRVVRTLNPECVELVHATPDLARVAMYGGPDFGWMADTNVAELDAASHASSIAILKRLTETFFPSCQAHYTIAPGRPIDVIMQAVEANPPDTMVVAASARGRVKRAVLGSTADKLVRQSPCPIIIIPAAVQ